MKAVVQLIFLFGAFLLCTPSFAQSKKQQELEEERQRLREEIAQMKQLREENKQKELSVLDQVESINSQISVRTNLIKIINEQSNLITREINANFKKIDAYRKELTVLKEEYAKMISRSYKSKSHQSKIMFLLSSSDFAQAYKRLQYMKQYNEHRREQAERIEQSTLELQRLNTDLSTQKKEKQSLVDENRNE